MTALDFSKLITRVMNADSSKWNNDQVLGEGDNPVRGYHLRGDWGEVYISNVGTFRLTYKGAIYDKEDFAGLNHNDIVSAFDKLHSQYRVYREKTSKEENKENSRRKRRVIDGLKKLLGIQK